jgi:type IV pilus assembly protein PilY1
MNLSQRSLFRRAWPALLLAMPFAATASPPFVFAGYPLFLAPAIKPNVLIVFDNSESMDGTMAGKVINGDDPSTRGNIARGVLRSVLQTYRDSFNWGLESFETTGDTLYNTHAYYFGDATTMVYTNDCVDGISASNGGVRCIPNPQPINGAAFITYDRSGDDADINDVLYSPWSANQLYGIGSGGTSYNIWDTRDTTTVWGNFGDYYGNIQFTPTDAGFLPLSDVTPREIFVRRGWGYYSNITGNGRLVETVQADSSAHFSNLLAYLGSETSGGTPEIKNSAVFTPLTGSLQTARNYFSDGGQSPITQTCQRNFVVLATDGNPTGRTDGNQYDPSQWVNTFNATTGTWTYGQALQDVFQQLTALRSTSVSGRTYDVQSYVVGMGDTVANPSSVAALNQMAGLGGGYSTAFLGSDSSALSNAFQSIVGDIQSKTSAASSAALNGGSWNTGSSLYQAKFSSADWSGDLVAYPVASTGLPSTTATWNAGPQIKSQNWDTGRKILTYKPSAAAGAHGITFRWPAVPASPTATELDISQTAALNLNATGSNDGFGSWRLQYLRGDASKEPRNCSTPPCASPQFRSRNLTPLGDIVNSSPSYVASPNFGYYDDMESAPYSGFVATYMNRTPMIYMGANDGMLHAINANNGVEALAYVPSGMYSGLSQLTDLNYSHRYFVDGTPTVGDVFYGGAWHSLLVSGLRAGGTGLFALDVTNPATFAEANAGSLVRWEFQDPDMGYIVGQPLIVKTNNGRWSVVVNGGYNPGNATGHAFLFIIDAETGALVRKMDTGEGSPSSPNGLSSPAAIDINGDSIADLVYAGDLDGNLWKFDISSTLPAAWVMGNGALPLFTTASGQSITSRPDATLFPDGGYLISFGTGRYLATSDTTNTTAQAEYGIRDTLTNGTVTLSQLQVQSITQQTTGTDGNTYRLSTHAVDPPSDPGITGDNVISRSSYYSTKKGWYVNLPTNGERVVANARIRGGRVILTSLIPDVSSPCAYGGSGWVMEFDALTGDRLDTDTFDTNGDNSLGSNDFLSFPGDNGGKHNASGRMIGAVPAAPGFMSNKQGTTSLEDKYINTSDGAVVRVRETAGKGGQARVMWREVK